MKLSAKDLRIGNYINGIYSDYENDDLEDRCRVLALDETGELLEHKIWAESQKSNTEYFFGFKPIPLTEEWLIKFNWKRLDKYTFTLNGWFIYKRKRGFVTGSKKRETLLLYVHNLQNWWYGNNMYELEIKQS